MLKAMFSVELAFFLALAATARSAEPIDRHALVTRHNVVRTACDEANPVQVGNGRFAFSADITGLQTFIPFNTMSEWGWHAVKLPQGAKLEDFTGGVWDTHGRPVAYNAPRRGKRR